MAAFALDTSCMVAAGCSWHEHHTAAVAAIEERLDQDQQMVTAAHALVETYAVLTRLPAPHRLSPADAWTLIHANFVESATLSALNSRGHVALLEHLAAANLGGGRTYDALIAACAELANVDAILTFNARHFEPAPAGVRVVVPEAR